MIEIYLHSRKFKEKPSANQAKSISYEICKSPVYIEPKELATALSNGKTMLCGIMRDNRRLKNNFLYQEVIALDFDDTSRLEDIKNNEFIKKNASFIYTTFRHTEDHERFRIVFVLNKRLVSNEQVETVYNKLFELFPDTDKSCKDSSRLFYGGKEYIEINFNNVFNVDDFVKLPEASSEIIQNEALIYDSNIHDFENKPTWWLIRHNHDELVKSRLRKYKASVEQQSVAMNYFNSLNMREFLGFKENGNIHDLFSEDNKPSVSVYEMEDGGVWLYTRHSDNPDERFTANLVQIVAKLKKTHYIGALNYLIEMTETDFNSSEIIKQLNTEIEIYTSLLNSKSLRMTSPNIYKIFKDGRSNYSSDVIQILQIFKNNVIEVDGEVRMITQLSSRELALMIYGDKSKKDRILRVLNLMTTTDWITKLDYDEIPLEIRSKVVAFQQSKKRSHYKNIFEFVELGGDFFDKLNGKCGDLIENNFSVKSTLTKIGLEKTFSKDEADRVFTQEKSREINNITKEIEDEAIHFIFDEIEKNEFVEERKVIDHLSNEFGKSFSEFKFKQIRTSIIKDYDLEKVRLNKALKKEFGVSDKYTQTQAPSIFIKTN